MIAQTTTARRLDLLDKARTMFLSASVWSSDPEAIEEGESDAADVAAWMDELRQPQRYRFPLGALLWLRRARHMVEQSPCEGALDVAAALDAIIARADETMEDAP